MDMNNGLVVGAGALLVGILIGYSMGGSGDKLAEEGIARTDALSAKIEQMAGKVDGLDSKVGGIESSFADLGTKQDAALKGIGDQIAGIGDTVTGAVDKLGAGVSDTVKSQISAVSEKLDGLRAEPEAAASTVTPGAEGSGTETSGAAAATATSDESEGDAPAAPAEDAASDAAAPAEGSGAGTALTPGMAAVIAPDKLHVFLSSADPTAKTATVAVNGQSLTTVSVGQETEANGCHFALTGFDSSGAAMIDGGC